MLGGALDETTAVTSGPLSPMPFADYDRHGFCWRTFQGTFPWDSGTYSETWPTSGMTLNGIAYRRRSLVPRTFGTECSLWPTPRASPGMAYRFSAYGVTRCWERNGNLEDVILRRYGAEAVGRYMSTPFVEELMGFPIGWTDCTPSATPSSRPSPNWWESGS
jgi:hypothetical protein